MGARPALATLLLLAAAGAGRPSRELPPPPTRDEEPKKEDAPFCGKVFKDTKVRGGAVCLQPSAGLLKSADIVAACGVAATAYLGETKDGAACRLHFQAAGGDPKETYAMVSHPVDPRRRAGADGPRSAAAHDVEEDYPARRAGLPGGRRRQPRAAGEADVLWAGRGRRIAGLHVSKQLCTPAQAEALLQKVIDAVP